MPLRPACLARLSSRLRRARTRPGPLAGLVVVLGLGSLGALPAAAQTGGYTCTASPAGASACRGSLTFDGSAGSWTITGITTSNGETVSGGTIAVPSGSGTFTIDLGTCVAGHGFPCSTGPATYTAASGQYGPSAISFTLNGTTTTGCDPPTFIGQGDTYTGNCTGVVTVPVAVSATVSNAGLTAPQVAPAFLACPAAVAGGTPVTCGTVTLTAGSGPFAIGSGGVSVSDTANFSIDPGSCANAAVLAAGGSCTTGAVTFHPATAAGNNGQPLATDVIVTALTGGPQFVSVSGVALPGGLSISPAILACPATPPGQTAVCATGLLVSTGVAVADLALSVDDTANFSLDPGTCGRPLAQQGTCQTGALTVHPQTGAALSSAVRASASNGTATAVVTAPTTYGTPVVTPSSVSCGAIPAGTATDCGMSLTLTATGGPLVLGAAPTVSNAAFSVDPGSCASGLALASGQSCTTGPVQFAPTLATLGTTPTGQVLFATDNGGGIAGVSGRALAGTAAVSPQPLACPTTAPGTTTVCNGGSGATITANGGPLDLATAGQLVIGGNAALTADPGSCATLLATGQSCTTGPVTFAPTAVGTYSTSAGTVAPVGGALVFVTAQAVLGRPQVSGTIHCPDLPVGSTETCTGTLTVTAVDGGLTVSGLTLSLDTTDFTLDPGSCTSAVLGEGETCTTGTATFTANAPGTVQALVTFQHSSSNTYSALYTLQAGGFLGTPTLTPTFVNCDPIALGSSGPCLSGGTAVSFTFSSQGGPLTLTHAESSNPAFVLDPGSCTDGLVLADGASCTTGAITVTPDNAGSAQTQVRFPTNNTVYDNSYGAKQATVQATGTLGTPVVSPTFVNCDGVAAGTSGPCLSGGAPVSLTFTAQGGPLTLTHVESTNAANFAIDPGSCTDGLVLAPGQSCTTGGITFSPQTVTELNTLIRFRSSNTTYENDHGAANAFVQGPGTAPTSGPPGVVSSLICPDTPVGNRAPCTGSITLEAGGNPVTVGNTSFNVGGRATESFDLSPDPGCDTGATLGAGQSCEIHVTFHPASAGTATGTVYVFANGAFVNAVTVTGNGTLGTPSVTSTVQCPATAVGGTAACSGAITLTALGGDVVVGNTSFNVGGRSTDAFDLVPDAACATGAGLAAGQSCQVAVTFHPVTAGTAQAVVYVFANNAFAGQFTVSGTAAAGATAAVGSSVVCLDTDVGGSVPCTGNVTVTAVGGPLTLGASTVTPATDFDLVPDGACGSGQALAAGQSCQFSVTFHPTATGTRLGSVLVVAAGQAYPTGVSGNGLAAASGVPTVQSTLQCPDTAVGASAPCSGSLMLTATDTPVTLGNTVAINDAADYELNAGTCPPGATIPAHGSCTATVTFHPASAGLLQAYVIVYLATGSPLQIPVSGTGTVGTLVASQTTIACGTVPPGAATTCVTALTLTATGGAVTVTQDNTRNLGDTTDFPFDWGTCSAAQTIASGQSCTTGAVRFAPQQNGPLGSYPRFHYNSTYLDFAFTGTSATAQAIVSPQTLVCPNALVGASVACNGAFTLTAFDAPVPLTGSIANSNATDFSLDPGTCTAGTTLAPGTSCTTGTLLFHPSAAATASAQFSFRAAGIASTLSAQGLGQGATSTWVGSGFGSCTGGRGTWTDGAWTPTTGCGTYTQTRTETCTGEAGSGTQTQTVRCQNASGATVADALCTGTKPATTQSCTPTGEAVCGTRPATSQPANGSSNCTFSWHASAWSACTGGTAHWSYGLWTPASGCGPTAQTRTGSCTFTAGSGQQTQTVTCQRSDGTTVADANCTGTKPVGLQSCTPSDPLLCGAEGSLAQTTTLSDACSGPSSGTVCTPTPENPYCVVVPLPQTATSL